MAEMLTINCCNSFHGAIPRCRQKKFAVAAEILPPKFCPQNFAVSSKNFAAAVAMAKDKLQLTLTFLAG